MLCQQEHFDRVNMYCRNSGLQQPCVACWLLLSKKKHPHIGGRLRLLDMEISVDGISKTDY